ncbi:MAG: hypothetical protein E6R05_01920 [Candidatus Moraniibacteriota bacterium]|nr:MAG: hypothetical protein E6R05_01920 [Candidatus Moranbacteria bacterium]
MNISSKPITEFNQSYPVGAKVELISLSNKPPIKTRITKEARRFFGANVVDVEGEPYPVNISRIKKVSAHV